MKLTIIIMFLCAFAAKAQDNPYESAILRGKLLLEEAEGAEGYQAAFNFFERVAQKEPAEWLPLYYQAQSLAIMSTGIDDPEKKDETLKKALAILKKAKQLEKNAEIVALEGFAQMIRLTVDPGTRGQTLAPTIFGLFTEALKLEPANPRALLFMGQMQHGTAQFFGSGFEEACKYIQNAYHIFEAQPGEETIYPDWGMRSATAMLQNCDGSN